MTYASINQVWEITTCGQFSGSWSANGGGNSPVSTGGSRICVVTMCAYLCGYPHVLAHPIVSDSIMLHCWTTSQGTKHCFASKWACLKILQPNIHKPMTQGAIRGWGVTMTLTFRGLSLAKIMITNNGCYLLLNLFLNILLEAWQFAASSQPLMGAQLHICRVALHAALRPRWKRTKTFVVWMMREGSWRIRKPTPILP